MLPNFCCGLTPLRTFLLIWFGQLVSQIGSGLTGFALGVHVFQTTGSTTLFALIALSTTLPGIVLSPVAGALVDRWDRRRVLILADTGAGVCTLVLAILLLSDRLEIWMIYLLMAASSSFGSPQWPAFSASTSLLVPKEQLGRAGGMTQFSEAAAMILSPLIAGLLVGVIGVPGVMLIDVATFLFAVGTLFLARIPQPPMSEGAQAARGSLLREAGFGWTYIRARAGLLALLIFFAATNYLGSMVGVLVTPMVLSFTTPAVLGQVSSAVGLGMLAGSLVMSAWGGPHRKVNGILAFEAIGGLGLMIVGVRPSPPLIALGGFIALFCLPITNGCSQAIWQRKVAADVQGRVFAVRRMLAWSSIPLAQLSAGPLADGVFEPLLAPGGALAASLGSLLGTGAGRGIGLLFIVLGVLYTLTTGVAALYPRLRNLELELPDAVPESSG
jgi:MFS family permease